MIAWHNFWYSDSHGESSSVIVDLALAVLLLIVFSPVYYIKRLILP